MTLRVIVIYNQMVTWTAFTILAMFCPIHAYFSYKQTKGCGFRQRMSLAIAWSYHINIVWVCCGHLWFTVGKLLAGVPLSRCTRGRVMTSVDLISKTNTISKSTPLEILNSFDSKKENKESNESKIFASIRLPERIPQECSILSEAVKIGDNYGN